MKLFNKYITLSFILAAFYSCNPLEDTYNELEKSVTQDGPGVPINYTMSSSDYESVARMIRRIGTSEDSSRADFVEDNLAFGVDVLAKDYLSGFVNDKFPQFGTGTAVKVTYDFFNGNSSDYTVYLEASEYELSDDDYAAANSDVETAGFFYPSQPADNFLPDILSASVQDAIDGSVYAISYQASSEDAKYDFSNTGLEVVFSDDLNSGVYNQPVAGYFAQSISGDQSWVWRDFSGDGYAYMSGFSGGPVENEDWIVLQGINLAGYENAQLDLNQACNYLGDGVFGTDIAIKVSTNFAGSDVTTATWTDVTPDKWPSGSNWTFVNSVIDLSDFTGETISIGFYYHSTTTFAAAWELSDIVVSGGAGPALDSKPPVEHVDYYSFDGSDWEKVEGVYVMNAYDYDAMGTQSGQPGRFNNFSADVPASNYLPQFLNNMMSYAVPGDEQIIVYKYYNGSFTQTLAETYSYGDAGWEGSFIIKKTEQYVHNGTEFLFDPSVILTMVSADYQMIVDVVKGTHPDLVDDFGTGEFYYGSGAYFENFDLGYTSRVSGDYAQDEYLSLSPAERKDLMIQRMGEGIKVLLEQKYVDAEPVDGVEVTYTVNSESYDGTRANWVTVFEVTGVGAFDLLEGPTKQ